MKTALLLMALSLPAFADDNQRCFIAGHVVGDVDGLPTGKVYLMKGKKPAEVPSYDRLFNHTWGGLNKYILADLEFAQAEGICPPASDKNKETCFYNYMEIYLGKTLARARKIHGFTMINYGAEKVCDRLIELGQANQIEPIDYPKAR